MTNNILIKRPIITEKSYRDASIGVYTFEVDKKANKSAIKQVVEETFKVHVKEVSTLILKGKVRRVGKLRLRRKLADIKKARVRLAPGEKIPLFDVGETK